MVHVLNPKAFKKNLMSLSKLCILYKVHRLSAPSFLYRTKTSMEIHTEQKKKVVRLMLHALGILFYSLFL
jgi:hypothetical protein